MLEVYAVFGRGLAPGYWSEPVIVNVFWIRIVPVVAEAPKP